MRSRAGSVKAVVQMLLGGIFFFGLPSVYAVDVNIKITGEIIVPACKIDNDATINVSFGDISLYDVNGHDHAQKKTVSITCHSYQGTPYVRMTGIQMTGAGSHVLKTLGANSSALGIALYQGKSVGSNALSLGAGTSGYGYPISNGLSGRNFTFTAVPYKQGSGTLNAGSFSATATMSITYL